MRYTDLAFNEDPVAFGIFTTGDTVTVEAFNGATGASLPLTSAIATEIGATGRFRWALSNITTPLADFSQILVIMENASGRQHDSKIVTGGFPSDLAIQRFQGAIHIDVAAGAAGTAFPLGTPENPVNNVADAKTIATANNVLSYQITGAVTINTNHDGWEFKGTDPNIDIITFAAGNSIIGATFEQLTILGDMSGKMSARDCTIGGTALTVTGIDGLFEDCGGSGTLRPAVGGVFEGLRFASRDILGTTIDFNGAQASWLAGSLIGVFTILNMTDPLAVFGTGLDAAIITFGPTNTSGVAILGGVGEFTDTSAGTAVVDNVLRGTRVDVDVSSRASSLEMQRLYSENLQMTLFFGVAGTGAPRNVAAGGISHMLVEVKAEAASDWTAPIDSYYVVFAYQSGAAATDRSASSNTAAAAPVDDTFTSVSPP